MSQELKNLKNVQTSLELSLWIYKHCVPADLSKDLYYLLPHKEKMWSVEELFEHYKTLNK